MPPNVPEAYLEARRQQIIEAAVSCFARKGFHKTTMQDICKAAGLSPGAVYNYFRSKEDIVAACAEMSERRNDDMVAAALAQDDVSPLNAVGKALYALATQEGIAQAMNMDLELWAESTRNPRVAESLRKNLDAGIARITELVERGQEQGIFSDELEPRAISQVLFSLSIGLEAQMTLNPDMDIDAYFAVWGAIAGGTLSKQRQDGQAASGEVS
jgi:AcrR family transcriptional regulator